MPQTARSWCVIVAVFVLCTDAFAATEVCKGSKVAKAKLATFDGHLQLTPAETKAAIATHLPFGTPACDKLLPLTEYVVCYDRDWRIPSWVAYSLTSADVVTKERRDAFRTDPRLTDDENAHCADYQGSGYDRGHAVPRDDMNRTFEIQADTFLLSNMAPQRPELNRRIWRWLEERGRDWAKKFGRIYIIDGPVVLSQTPKRLGGRVVVPSEFFKIFIREDASGDLTAQTFLFINTKNLPTPPGSFAKPTMTAAESNAYLVKRATSMTAIEILTGLNFLSDLSATKQDAIEWPTITALWPLN